MAAQARASEAGRAQGEERLGFLLARYGHALNLRMRQALCQTGLGARQASTLLRLAALGPTGQQQLIEALGLDASALVAVLNDLERDGLVVRTRDPMDRRRHIVAITAAGERAAQAIDRAVEEMEQDAFTDLDESEVAQLRALLCRVRVLQTGDACTP